MAVKPLTAATVVFVGVMLFVFYTFMGGASC
jgi:hypothetical protein